METAETRRTRWPKNRCYIYGGSVEASKYSCSSSSSSPPSSYLSTSPESDQKPDSAVKEPHNTISDYLSSYPNPNPNPNVSAQRQRWLNTDPNSSRHRDFMSAQQVSSEDDFVLLGEEFPGRGESRSVGSGKEARDIWFLDDHLMDLDSLNSLVSSEESKKLASEFESQWVGSDKTEPWWRSSGKDDLASMVAQKSLEIENCDLPRPRIYRKLSSSCSRSLDRDDILASSLDRTVETCLSSQKSTGPPNDSQQTLRSESEKSEEQKSKDELLRALCLSQKRAREAEEAAKKAHSEKERVITLIFRQASHLFTYKQWIHLLQLEKICLQNQPICDLFPWAPRQPKKGRHRPKKRPRDDIGKCGLAFVLGLGLAGAGLLLGWTMGWLFPSP